MLLLKIAVAIAAAYLIFRIGLGMLRVLTTPAPEPPPPGELRQVRATYRCALCGTEVQMRVAPTESPDPPRHCMEEMELVTPLE